MIVCDLDAILYSMCAILAAMMDTATQQHQRQEQRRLKGIASSAHTTTPILRAEVLRLQRPLQVRPLALTNHVTFSIFSSAHKANSLRYNIVMKETCTFLSLELMMTMSNGYSKK